MRIRFIMSRLCSVCSMFFIAVLPLLFLSQTAFCGVDRYDLVYIWDKDLDKVLDYKEHLEEVLDDRVKKKLVVVGRDNEYGIIYDRNGSARSVTADIVLHGEKLRAAGLDEANAIKDEGYDRLYNVSYGVGPNVDALKKTYHQIYNYLGKGVGKDLFIEKISENNYTLIYRRRGDRRSTATIARLHAKKLKRKKISTTIIAENNNPVVYGESSHLDEEAPTVSKSGKVDTDSDCDAGVVKKPKVVQPKPLDRIAIQESKTKEVIVAEVKAKKHPVKEIKITAKKKVIRSKQQLAKGKRAKSPVVIGSSSSSVEQHIESLIKNLRRKGRISSDERTGWVVYDLERDKTVVDINANSSFQAASMIKPFVALAFFNQVKKGKIKYGPKSRAKMEAMIQRSSNSATNWVMRTAGGPAKVNRILNNEYGHIFKNTRIVEYIPAGGRTYRNKALPSDYVRFLRSLWNKELPYGKEMRRLMALPGRDRLYHGTPIPQGTLVYNKTGSTAHLCGDMGILAPRSTNGGRYPYAIVGIIERESRPANYGSWVTSRGKVIRQVSTLVYKEMKKNHRLR